MSGIVPKNYVFRGMKKGLFLSIILVLASLSPLLHASDYYYAGNGTIKIGRGYKIKPEEITFRNSDGTYNEKGLKKINELYGSSWNEEEFRMSLRLIELLDYLEDYYKSNGIKIISGYRSPDYNQSLRNKGKIAASSSLHLDAEAIDIVMNGVPSSRIFDYLKEQDCCGIGYYHGKTIHVDTGPPRFWDETTSGTESRELPENRFVAIKTDRDFYKEGEQIRLGFSRVNEYPLGIKKDFQITCEKDNRKKTKKISPLLDRFSETSKGCVKIASRRDGRSIKVEVPAPIMKDEAAKCSIKVEFCDFKNEKMPDSIMSNPFKIRVPKKKAEKK